MNFSALGAMVNLNGNSKVLHYGCFLITYSNLMVIVLMFLVFIIAIALPSPTRKHKIIEPNKEVAKDGQVISDTSAGGDDL